MGKVMEYLKGEKVRLVKFTDRHVTARYVEWLNDHKVNRYMFAGRIPLSREEITIPDGQREMRFAMMSNLTYEENQDALIQNKDYLNYIGTASINSIDWISRRAEIGYMIGEDICWGAGIATEVVRLLMDYCFNRLNMNKLEAGVVEGNAGSVKVLERNGFKQYGAIPQEYYLEGQYLRSDRFYKLQEWHRGVS